MTRLTLSLVLLFSFRLLGQKLTISHLTGDFYVYTTYSDYQGTPYPANGMYVLTNDGALIIDSPWDTTQFQPLIDSIKMRHGKDVKMCIATHFHDDRTAGLEYFRRKGIRTYTTAKTDQLSKERDMKRAEFLIHQDTTFVLGGRAFRVIYPGPGHAPDNIVVWFEKERILYGGCLVKSVDDKTLGNLADANNHEYAATLCRLMHLCRKPAFVIPGHNSWRSVRAVKHTWRMAKKLDRGAHPKM